MPGHRSTRQHLRPGIARLLAAVVFGSLTAVMPWTPQAAFAAAPVRYLKIVQLGDSYSAGNGAGEKKYVNPPGCYRNTANWGSKYSTWLANQPGNAAFVATSVNYVNSACNGAVGHDILNPTTSGLPPQVEAATGADLVLMTMGGNDLLFSSVVKQCLTSLGSTITCRDRLDAARAQLDSAEVREDWVDALTGVAAAISSKPSAKIVLAGYPHLVGDINYRFRMDAILGFQPAGAEGRRLATDLTNVQGDIVREANRRLGRPVVIQLPMLSAFDGYAPIPNGPDLVYDRAMYDRQRRGSDRLHGQASTAVINEWYHPNPAGHDTYVSQLQRAGGTYGDFGVWTPPAPVITAPAAPVLSAGAVTQNSVALSWTRPAGATGYRVYEGNTNTLVTSTTDPIAAATAGGLAPNTTHTYTVTAVNSGGESPRSNALTRTTLHSWMYEFVGQNAVNSDGSSGADLAHARPGQTFLITVSVRNKGTAMWTPGGSSPVLLATAQPNDHSGALQSSGWISASRPAGLREDSVPPGAVGSFQFRVTAPTSAGTVTEHYSPVAENTSWMSGPSLSVTITTTPIVGVAAAAGTAGQWLVASDGGVFAQGGAPFFGSLGGKQLNAPIVGVVGTPSGRGYWLVGADGGVFAFGDAPFHGSKAGQPLSRPIVGMAPTPTGAGYWLVGADGGVFTFGNAPFAGSMAGKPLNAAISGIAGTPSGAGYRLVAADGGVFAFGDASFAGSMGGKPLNAPITGMVSDPLGNGYWLVGRDGGIYAFEAPFLGSSGATGSPRPIVGLAVSSAGYGTVDTSGGYTGYARTGSGPADGTLFKEAGSAWVYVCYGGAKFRIPDAASFDALGLSWNAVRTLPDGSLAAVSNLPIDGTVLREQTNPSVYRIEGGHKRLLALPEFIAGNYGAVLKYVPDGGLINIPNG